MSTELRDVPECHGKFTLQQTRFFGGINRGTCLQVTQPDDNELPWGGNTPLGSIQLTKDQARLLAGELMRFVSGIEVEKEQS
jgi:hypothetical protein